MYHIERSALIPYSARQMYDLVNDVDRYGEFLPWCGGGSVLDQSDGKITAEVVIAFKGIHKTFSTENTLSPYEEIHLRLINGPFSELGGLWRFQELDESSCKISLDLEFGFSNKLVGAVIGPVFKKIADNMVDAFCKRAETIYS